MKLNKIIFIISLFCFANVFSAEQERAQAPDSSEIKRGNLLENLHNLWLDLDNVPSQNELNLLLLIPYLPLFGKNTREHEDFLKQVLILNEGFMSIINIVKDQFNFYAPDSRLGKPNEENEIAQQFAQALSKFLVERPLGGYGDVFKYTKTLRHPIPLVAGLAEQAINDNREDILRKVLELNKKYKVFDDQVIGELIQDTKNDSAKKILSEYKQAQAEIPESDEVKRLLELISNQNISLFNKALYYFQLGEIYFYGQGLSKPNYNQARRYFELASNQDVNRLAKVNADFMLGQFYYAGRGSDKPDYVRARTYYELVSAQKIDLGLKALADYILGSIYYHGRGLDQPDYVRAKGHYELAVENSQLDEHRREVAIYALYLIANKKL